MGSNRSGIVLEEKTDDEMFEIQDLASDFQMYDFDKISIKGFSINELMLIAKARATNDTNFIIQAMQNVVNIDVDYLTIPDFKHLLYWLRIESYPKTPMYMPWKCDNTLITKDDKPSICGSDNLDRLSKSSLKIVRLKECEGYAQPLPPELDYPRVSVFASIADKDPKDPYHAIYKVAMWVKEGKTIDEKIAIMQKDSTLKLYESALEVAGRLRYGVRESVNVKCKECGANRFYIMSISAATFLPGIK